MILPPWRARCRLRQAPASHATLYLAPAFSAPCILPSSTASTCLTFSSTSAAMPLCTPCPLTFLFHWPLFSSVHTLLFSHLSLWRQRTLHLYSGARCGSAANHLALPNISAAPAAPRHLAALPPSIFYFASVTAALCLMLPLPPTTTFHHLLALLRACLLARLASPPARLPQQQQRRRIANCLSVCQPVPSCLCASPPPQEDCHTY